MIVKITNIDTKETKEIGIGSFKDYCSEMGWQYDDVKNALNKPGIHYRRNKFTLTGEDSCLSKKAEETSSKPPRAKRTPKNK